MAEETPGTTPEEHLERDDPVTKKTASGTAEPGSSVDSAQSDSAPSNAAFAGEESPKEEKRDVSKEKIKGVFSSQTIEKVGTGTTVRKTISKTFWMAEEKEDGHIQIQPLNVNYVPSGPKRTVAKEDLLRQFNPEPEFYMQTVFPAMQKVNQAVELGENHRKKGKNFSAEFEFENALKVDVENVRANFGLGLTYLERGEVAKADNIFERLVNLDAAFDPEHKHLFNDFGINLRQNKMYDQAVDYYERAMELSKGDEHLHYNIARAYYAKQLLDKTVDHLRTALKMNSQFEAAQQFMDWLKEKEFITEDGQVNPDAKLPTEEKAPQKAASNSEEYNMDF